MVETTEIERKSLEAHVELCAERYNALEIKLDMVETKLAMVDNILCEVRTMIQAMSDKRTDQLFAWGAGTIGVLVATVGYLLATYAFK